VLTSTQLLVENFCLNSSVDINTIISKRPYTQCKKKNLLLHLLHILILFYFIYYNIFLVFIQTGISAYYLNIDSTDPLQ
jgi:hypothetical protein